MFTSEKCNHEINFLFGCFLGDVTEQFGSYIDLTLWFGHVSIGTATANKEHAMDFKFFFSFFGTVKFTLE